MRFYSLILALIITVMISACGNGSTTTNEVSDRDSNSVDCCIDSTSIDTTLDVNDTTHN